MKLLFAILLTLPSVVLAAPFDVPVQVPGTDHLFRGAQPVGHSQVLVDAGITEVVIYKNDTRGEVVREITELKEVGFSDRQIHHLPMKWKDIELTESCEHTIKALQILIRAERDGKNTYFHCTAGEDRTGMIAGLSRMLLNRDSAEEVFSNEMCAQGYSDGNPNKPAPVTQAIEKGLTPLFFALAEKIESGALNTENLLPEMCGKLEVKPLLRKCRP
jgi:hypothetical protein